MKKNIRESRQLLIVTAITLLLLITAIIVCIVLLIQRIQNSSGRKQIAEISNVETKIATVEDEIHNESKEIKIVNQGLTNSIMVTDIVAKENNGENVMFSPTSLNFTLGMLQMGAQGETRDIITSYLQKDNYSEFAKNYLMDIERYNTEETEYTRKNALRIANSMWINKDEEIKDSFVEEVDNFYTPSVFEIDATDGEKTSKEINTWVNEKTEGFITEIVKPEDISDNIHLYLVNTVYFNSPWRNKWSIPYDENGKEILSPFQTVNGGEEKTCYMKNRGDYYYENDYATAFGCLYDEGIEFIGILPKKKGNFTLSSLDIPGLLLTKTRDFNTLEIKMPRLNYETYINMKEALETAGYDALFQNADFSKISDENVSISGIIQKTRIDLNENATTAAAATAVSIECTSLFEPQKKSFSVHLNRPFAFLIYDQKNEEVLFVGKNITTKE